jgi:beta-1,4-galactosyltransferase 1
MDVNKRYWLYKKQRKLCKIVYKSNVVSNEQTPVAIIVPYRNTSDNVRKMQLKKFCKHMINFFGTTPFRIFVIEQSNDGEKFNRGMLLNIGLLMAIKRGYNILITHDVDLLPSHDMLNYYAQKYDYPMHIAWQWKTKYTFDEYFGGVVSLTPEIVKKTNGYANSFWGWGGEDDSLYNRIGQTIGTIIRPTSGTIKDLSHDGPTTSTINDKKKENILNDMTGWTTDGINSLKYEIVQRKKSSCYKKITVNLKR